MRRPAVMDAIRALTVAAELAIALTAASAPVWADSAIPLVAVGSQYDSTHVYVSPENVDRFADSFVATFGGQSSRRVITTVTPTPSSTIFRFLQTPAGTISLFGFETPIPYPFGTERTGYLVTDLDVALGAARAAGAEVIVAPFPDPIGRDAVIRWPGGVEMQLYWHFTKPVYAPFASVPENRVYLSADSADAFVRAFITFSQGKIVSDEAQAPGVEIGQPKATYRRIRIESLFGKLTVLVTDGHLPFPYGREVTGYEVADLATTLFKAKAAGGSVLVGPYAAERRNVALVEFPGGYVAEIHSLTGP
jgi:predicted enzyme related to lactoylglutathione lyase